MGIYEKMMEEMSVLQEMDEQDEKNVQEAIDYMMDGSLNILFTGATGAGKSSTINAIFQMEMAGVGEGPMPETDRIEKYEMEHLVLWDTPGFGDSPEADRKYCREMASLLEQKDADGRPLLDAVVLVFDGSTRDQGTAFQILEEDVLPNKQEATRLLFAVNQCDMILKGQDWEEEENCPGAELDSSIAELCQRLEVRIGEILDAEMGDMRVVPYSAYRSYNIAKLLGALAEVLPLGKRFLLGDYISQDPGRWNSNDDSFDFDDFLDDMADSLESTIDDLSGFGTAGAAVGLGMALMVPVAGLLAAAVIGGTFGFLKNLIDE